MIDGRDWFRYVTVVIVSLSSKFGFIVIYIFIKLYI